MKHIFYITSFVLILLTSACKTSFRITVRTPPEIVMADSVKSLLMINNVNDKNSPDEMLAKITLGSNQINGNITASENCFNGFTNAFNQTKDLKVVQGNPVEIIRGNEIDWKLVDSLCAKNNSHALIEIVRVESKMPIGGTLLANAAQVNRVPITAWMTFNVYTANSHLSVKNIRLEEIYYMQVSGNTNPLNMLNDVLRKRNIFTMMGYNLGHRAGNMFFEHWQWVNRQYYNKGGVGLRRARKMIRFGNWNIAEKQLEAGISSPKNKVAGRSKYNLALVYEGQGRLDEAILMAERAAMENGTKLAYEYIQILQRRKNFMPNFVLQ
jgi:tetratricopeptide (TPR) repeat protein